MILKIRALVNKTFSSMTNLKQSLEIGKVSNTQAKFIKENCGIDLKGCLRYMDNYGIRHTILKHGNQKIESKRGQIAVTLDDFERVASIVDSPDKIEYVGKNKLGRECFKFTKKIDLVYYVVESVRTKNKNKMFMESMYKRKATR